LAARGNNGNARSSFKFAEVFARQLLPLNDALQSKLSEQVRTPRRVDKLGATGSSPVPPT